VRHNPPDAQPFRLTICGVVCALVLMIGLSGRADAARRDVKVLHTYASSTAWEVINAVAVNAATLAPLLPAGYQTIPASALGLGSPTQGIVVLANYQGLRPSIDQRSSGRDDQVAIDVGILVAEPAEASLINVNLPGAFHIYTLAIYTDDAGYAASLQGSGMPVELVRDITYDRQFVDATGFGTLTVNVSNHDASFHSINTGFGYQPVGGALNAVFWHWDHQGTSALHFHNEPFLQGQALSQVYLRPDSRWGSLLLGGGIGPCPADPASRSECVSTPSLNFRYPQGSRGQLTLITG
jgi:hypothetical protein